MKSQSGVKAITYGAVLINVKGEVLLREPTGQFGCYAWTFAKGRPLSGEAPEETALRHVRGDTGWDAEILADIPGVFPVTTSISKFYLAGRIGELGKPDAETAATRWVSFEEAPEYIRQSPNAEGRERDLAILRAANEARADLAFPQRPAACSADWEIQPMPAEDTVYDLDLCFTAEEMARIRKGFLPTDMDEKWFMWFEDDILYFHRSWTGVCIFQVSFLEMAEGHWRAVSAVANRCPEQYTETDEDAERALIKELIDYHLTPDEYGHVSGFVEALSLASQPNYLGSPAVVSALIMEVGNTSVEHFKGQVPFHAVWDAIEQAGYAFTEDSEYVRMPGWHTTEGMGRSLSKAFHIRDEHYIAELDFHISEACMAMFFKIREMLTAFVADPLAEWKPHALPQLSALHHWVVSAFLGTNEALHPGVSIDDFHWKAVTVAD